ncbi:Crp/Fnr family transcriptional regulator [Maribacter spongiicola]|uniref:Crp/Fnr family transcriptional regulator n=1 Tax=Maribacter spongiicola TaxID=1206753 RepID=UPI003F962897
MNILPTQQTQKFLKGDILLKQGEVTKYGYLVKNGCLKSYTLDSSGKEHILQFAPEDWMISDLDSFTNEIPSIIYIEAIEDSEVVLISKSDIKDIKQLERPELIEIAIKFRNNLIATNKRIIGLLSATAEERYIDFTLLYPTLVKRLPLKLIAAYIGVTPEYLSDIRRNLVKK